MPRAFLFGISQGQGAVGRFVVREKDKVDYSADARKI